MLQRVDQLNIILILISAILAYHIPLELFILSFAILGPLHYLTEINWLNSKSFYFTRKNTLWLVIGTVASTFIVLPKLFIEYLVEEGVIRSVMIAINSWSNGFIFATLMLAIGYQFIKSLKGWLVLSMIILIVAILLNGMDYYNTIIGLFVPTIIHVYLFTILFMLYGAKKAKSTYGYIAVTLLLIVPIAFVYIKLAEGGYVFPDDMKSVYLSNNFHVTPVIFSKYLGLSDGTTFFFYENMELRIMMFISFIYLYHYLNWFSKTTTIKWHKSLSLYRTIIILGVWFIMLTIFYVNFRLGFLLSLFLSILHVILEFPLNIMSIKGILKRS